jgi:hypothetical protein
MADFTAALAAAHDLYKDAKNAEAVAKYTEVCAVMAGFRRVAMPRSTRSAGLYQPHITASALKVDHNAVCRRH